MSKVSPTQRTLKLLRNEGYTAQVVEKFVSWIHSRIDLFHCIDIVAVRSDIQGVLGVQTTSQTHASDHVKKALGVKELQVWLEAGNKFEVWSWGKKGARGKAKKWQVDKRKITLDNLKQ